MQSQLGGVGGWQSTSLNEFLFFQQLPRSTAVGWSYQVSQKACSLAFEEEVEQIVHYELFKRPVSLTIQKTNQIQIKTPCQEERAIHVKGRMIISF